MAFWLKGCALGAIFFFFSSIIGYSGLRIQGMVCTTSCDFAALRQSGQFFHFFTLEMECGGCEAVVYNPGVHDQVYIS